MKPLWQQELEQNEDQHAARLLHHQKHPHVSLCEYSRGQRLALGRDVLQEPRVYLDQKYWIYCRDAAIGRPQKPVHTRIYEVLKGLIEHNAIVCPVSWPVLAETMKQKDTAKRMQTARTVDQLSRHIALQPPELVAKVELLYAMYRWQGDELDLWRPEEMVWTWAGLAVQELIPVNTGLSAVDELAFQKAMFDVFAGASLSSMVEAMTGPDEPPIAGGEDFADWQTEQSPLHRDEFRTFDEAFWIELCGALSVLIPEMYGSLAYVHERLEENSLPKHDGTMAQHALGLFRGWLRSACREQKLPALLPSLHVTSGIHAAIRYQNRPHDKGDLHDQLHASVAVPYCTIFCTDRKLANLLTDSLLGYDELFSCQILGNDEEVVAALEAFAQ